MKTLIAVAGALLVLTGAAIQADVPRQIYFQGRLTSYNLGGLTGDTAITFRLYHDSMAGSPVWQETHIAIHVTNGVFGVFLGDVSPLAHGFDTSLYLGVQVHGYAELTPRGRLASVGSAMDADRLDGLHGAQLLRSDASDTLNGSLKVTGTAEVSGFSMGTGAVSGFVLTSDAAGVGTWQPGGGGESLWELLNTNVYRLTGNVGIGTSTPLGRLHVNGSLFWGGGTSNPYARSDVDASGLFIEHRGSLASNEKLRVQASKTGDQTNYSTFSISPSNGFSFAANGTANGRVGIGTASPVKQLHVLGDGIVLDNGGADLKLWGASDNVEHNHYLQLLNATGLGNAWGLKSGGMLVADNYAYANPGKNDLVVKGNVAIGIAAPVGARLDVRGDNVFPGAAIRSSTPTDPSAVIINNSTGTGLYVGNTAPIGGANFPLHVVSNNNDAAANGLWVRGKSQLEGNVSVAGYMTSQTGLNGVNAFTGTSSGDYSGVAGINIGIGNGVYGSAPGPGFAGYFNGKVHVAGTLTKAAGSFKIDHPLDPDHKYLSHSFVESPDMMNVYNGNAILDAKGEAVVMLPSYFEALNSDYRYQLTCIGGFAGVYVAKEIEGGSFRIGGGKPGLKVSWQVTGIRQDPYAVANRIVVEELKSESQ